jgi:hypothetical protein
MPRDKALARWDNEGGAGPQGPQRQDMPTDILDGTPAPMHAELLQLRVRVIALENVMIALLAEASNGQRTLARGLAATITPRPGSTQHPLTIDAARQMLNLVERAEHLGTTGAVRHQGDPTSN